MPNVGTNKKQLVLNSKVCVDNEALYTNVRYNLDTIDKWIEPLQLHDRRAVVVSAGPSTKKHLDTIKRMQEDGADVFCVKHALPILLEANIEPKACIVLDPRDVNGISTHGIKRSDLFDSAVKVTTFLVASMTSRTTVDHLIDLGHNVIGWHAAVGDLTHVFRGEMEHAIIGGSSSATRGLYLLHALGYRFITCVGYDSCIEGEPTEEQMKETADGKPKYMKVEVLGKKYWTTGELTCQAQDLETMWRVNYIDVLYNFLEGGMVGEVFKANYAPAKQKTLDTWWDSVL